MKSLFLVAFVVTASIFVSCSKEEPGGMNSTDEMFMASAAYTDIAAIDFGNLALSKSNTDSVTIFATMMIADHTSNLYALRDSLAMQLNYKYLPSTLDTAHQSLKSEISPLSGYSFDTAYINGQIRDHQSAINMYQSEINNGFNKAIKSFASQKLPMLEMHLERAMSVSKSLRP